MSAADKLEFVEWLKVRDTVAGVLVDKAGIASRFAKSEAEELIAANVIDIEFILRERPDPEVELDATPNDWVPTHEMRSPHGGLNEFTYVRVIRATGNQALIQLESGSTHSVDPARLSPLGWDAS